MNLYMKKNAWILVAIGFTAAIAALQLNRQKAPADIVCHTAGSTAPGMAVLVIGESWAAGGRLLPGMAETVRQRLGRGSVKVCTIGYSGRNASQLLDAVHEDLTQQRISELLGDHQLKNIVILAGVNDVVQHVGKASYVAGVQGMVDYWPGLKVEAVEIPRVIETGVPSGLASQAKRFVQRHVFDDGKHEVIETYRAALAQTNISTISYDPFIPSYLGNEGAYAPDGIHLTLEMYQSYGKYLGSRIKLD